MRARPRLRDLPNVLSLTRVFFAASFVAADGVATRAGIIGVAGLTDLLDGWLARRLNAATRRGALIDPVADRVFVLAATVTLVADGLLGVGSALVVLARDIATAVGFLVALVVPWLRAQDFKARWLGKVVTILQFLTLFAALVARALLRPLLAAVAVTAAAAITDYTLALWRSRAR
jgi:cardiolipin synthase (CMP-forming)